MATGKQMLEAVRDALRQQPEVRELRLSPFDAYDLFKLEPDDLLAFGADRQQAEAISAGLARESLVQLGAWLGVKLEPDKDQKNLIPCEGIRRTAGIWASGDESIESIVEEVHRMRNTGAR